MTGNPEAHDYAAWAEELLAYKIGLCNMGIAEFEAAKPSPLDEFWKIAEYNQIAQDRALGVVDLRIQ